MEKIIAATAWVQDLGPPKEIFGSTIDKSFPAQVGRFSNLGTGYRRKSIAFCKLHTNIALKGRAFVEKILKQRPKKTKKESKKTTYEIC